jgi:hypothetical protein
MSDKGGHRVVKICCAVRPECLVRNAAMDVFAIDDRQKPDNPSAGIICFAGGGILYARDHFLREEGVLHRFSSGGKGRLLCPRALLQQHPAHGMRLMCKRREDPGMC